MPAEISSVIVRQHGLVLAAFACAQRWFAGDGLHLYLVDNHRLVGKLHKRLRHCKSEWPEASAIAADENQSFHVAVLKCASKETWYYR